MIYTLDIIGDQWIIFIKAVHLGVILGGCYDAVRIVRVIIHFKKTVFIASDFIYCIWAAFLIFSFLLNENFGIPRFYIFLGVVIGAFVWYFTVGKINMAIAKRLRKILRIIFRPILKIFQKISKLFKNCTGKAKIFYEKAVFRLKRLLKKKTEMVYNIRCLNVPKTFLLCGKKVGKEPGKVESNGTEKNEERNFLQGGSCCLHGVSAVFSDSDTSEYQQKEK